MGKAWSLGVSVKRRRRHLKCSGSTGELRASFGQACAWLTERMRPAIASSWQSLLPRKRRGMRGVHVPPNEIARSLPTFPSNRPSSSNRAARYEHGATRREAVGRPEADAPLSVFARASWESCTENDRAPAPAAGACKLAAEPASVQERWFALLYFLKPTICVLALFLG